jgi:biopolymer transport protein ExbD
MGAKLGGGGGNKYDLGQNSEINVTPFVDVMLVLLIIFMVAAPMATVSIALDAPPPLPSTGTPPKPPTTIYVQNNGQVFIGEKQTSLANLAGDVDADLRARGVTGPTTEERVFVSANKDAMYDQFMAVLNQLQASGYFKIGLINEDIE